MTADQTRDSRGDDDYICLRDELGQIGGVAMRTDYGRVRANEHVVHGSTDDDRSPHYQGPLAAQVTVSHLLKHQSGLADFDVNSYEDMVLANESHSRHDPLEDLQFVANLTGPVGCQNRTCTWLFEPGTGHHFAYSSTNFVLAGLVLLAHAPAGQRSWDTVDVPAMLGVADWRTRYPHTFFPAAGPMNERGLNTVGSSHYLGKTDMWAQDAS